MPRTVVSFTDLYSLLLGSWSSHGHNGHISSLLLQAGTSIAHSLHSQMTSSQKNYSCREHTPFPIAGQRFQAGVEKKIEISATELILTRSTESREQLSVRNPWVTRLSGGIDNCLWFSGFSMLTKWKVWLIGNIIKINYQNRHYVVILVSKAFVDYALPSWF